MNKDRAFELAQRWRRLVSRTKDLDWDKTLFAKDLRAEFGSGGAGDKALIKWCETEIGMPSYVATELLLRATVAGIVDKEAYVQIGGFGAVRQIAALDLRQQVHVVQSAKLQNKTVRSVMREQGLLPPPPEPVADPDAVLLATFIIEQGIKLPKEIAKVVAKYKTRHLKAA